MFKFWPIVKHVCLASTSLVEYVADYKLYEAECKRKFSTIKWEKPKENEMKKSEARKAAEKLQGKIIQQTSMHEDDECFHIKLGGVTLALFPYTPEPPPIKEGVLCVGVSPHGDMSIGVSLGRLDPDGMLHCSSYLVRGNAEKRLKNARPVTPADLVKWGLESTWSCSNCKNEGNSTICGKCEYITWRGRFEKRG